MNPDIAARRGPLTVEILKLRIELDHVQPTVWRTVLLRSSSSLSTLHRPRMLRVLARPVYGSGCPPGSGCLPVCEGGA